MMHRLKTIAAAIGAITISPISSATVLLDADFEGALNDYSTAISFSGDSSSAAINIRSANDSINTWTNAGFDGFFGSQFLVIGDEADGLGKEPNGVNRGALTRIDFLTGALSAGTYSLRISFDYAFDTNLDPTGTPSVSPDDFSVSLFGGGSSAQLLSFDSVERNSASTRGHYDELLTFTSNGIDPIRLAFELTEYRDPNLPEGLRQMGSSAVGLDNLQIATVPLPGTLILFGTGLAGLGFSGARRRRRLPPAPTPA